MIAEPLDTVCVDVAAMELRRLRLIEEMAQDPTGPAPEIEDALAGNRLAYVEHAVGFYHTLEATPRGRSDGCEELSSLDGSMTSSWP